MSETSPSLSPKTVASARPKPNRLSFQPIDPKLVQIPNIAKTENNESHTVKQEIEQQQMLKLDADSFEFIEKIGSGSGGVVLKALYKPNNIVMAQKVMNIVEFDVMSSAKERNKKNILRELKILRICNSPYIIKYYGSFVKDSEVAICMEFMDLGSLEKLYQTVGNIPEEIVGKISVFALEGLKYLFEVHKIIHRDIKPSNILINSQGQVKIADFGVSKQLINTTARTFTGTQGYLAPERLRSSDNISIESDIWSLGLTLMEIAIGRFPFPPEGYPPLTTILDMLSYIEDEPSPTLPADSFSVEFQDFVAQCLVKDIKFRPSPNVLLYHQFCQGAIKQGLDLVPWLKSVNLIK